MKKHNPKTKILVICTAILLLFVNSINNYPATDTSNNANPIQVIKPLCDEPTEYVNN